MVKQSLSNGLVLKIADNLSADSGQAESVH